jgi:hypothetical protein
VAGSAHVSGNKDGLACLLKEGVELLRTGAVGSGGPLSVDAELFALMNFELGNVVAHIIEKADRLGVNI